MSRRDHIVNILVGIISAVVAGVLARYGITIPTVPATPPPAQIAPAVPPVTPPPAPELPAADPMGARVKLRTSQGGCTGVVIDPQRPDGRYLVVTAAHCVRSQGEGATGTLPGGETLALVVQGIDRRADCAWMLSDPMPHPIPYARLAGAPAAPGRRVWVAGYGTHAPGVQRFGEVTSGVQPNGQCRYRIAVSPGDSGGPIVDDVTGEVLGVVCCTSSFGQAGDVYAAGPAAMLALKPGKAVIDPRWEPVTMPDHKE